MTRNERFIVAMVGLVLGLAMVGPGLAPGSLLNLDLVAGDHWSTPRALWGLGPELGRAMPFELILSVGAFFTSGATAVKTLFVISTAVACLTMFDLGRSRGLGTAGCWAAALLYCTGPFFATRMGVGHLTMISAMAILPWAHPRLLGERGDRNVVLAAFALATMGFYGGLLTVPAVAVGLWGRSFAELRRVVWRVALAQLVWLVPGVVLLLQGPEFGDAANFPSGLSRWDAPWQMITGHGFWQERYQVGASKWIVLVAGSAIFLLAGLGYGRKPDRWSGRSALLGAGIALIVLADATPGLRGVWRIVTSLPTLAALREPHRLLPLLLVPLAIWVAAGADVVAERVPDTQRLTANALPFALAAVLGAPAMWGLGGQLNPVETPPGWSEARSIIAAEPGPAVILPWHRYLNVTRANERVLNPAIAFFGPDVIAASDLELGEPTRETVDPRESTIDAIVDRIGDEPVGNALRDAGVRWVVLTHDADYQPLLTLLRDAELTAVLADRDIDLFEVHAWAEAAPERPIAPIALFSGDPTGRIWSEPYAPGWLQGFTPVDKTGVGTMRLTGSGTIVWYWPGLLVMASSAVWVVLAFVAIRNGVSQAPMTSDL